MISSPIDDTPLVLVAPRLHLHLDEAVRWVFRHLEGLRQRDPSNGVHVVLHKIADVALVVEMLKSDLKVRRCLLVGSGNPLAEKSTSGGIGLAKANADPAE